MSNLPSFMEIFMIAAWEIWKLRNAVIFDGARPSFNLWAMRFRDQAQLQLHRFNNDTAELIRPWLSSF